MPDYFRIFPSQNESRDTPECIKLKKELAEEHKKSESLQKELSNIKSTLTSSRQEHEALLSKFQKTKESLEKTSKSLAKQKADNDRMKRAKDDCFSRIDRLKQTNQTLTSNLKKSQNLCQTLGDQLKSQGLSEDAAPSNTENTHANQASRKEYLELKKKYRDLLTREQLVEKKMIDFTLQMQESQSAENIASEQRLYKQLSDTLAKENRLLTNMNKIKLEKQAIWNEKRALQEKFNSINADIQKLQAAERIWLADNRNLQDKLKIAYDNLTKMQPYALENQDLKEKVKTLAETFNTHKQSTATEITRLKDSIKVYELSVRGLKTSELTWRTKATNMEITKKALHMENAKLLKELKLAQKPWFSLN
ncbi:hypothetical protein [Parasitella parasitica]|uniref:Uncharacterized protein n=1 Tax=Parasitella parasitica TaxID=35722 RepID=A0A0B7NPK4_9FUNG|nr:hypothetical protein [Parasitella parasitica]